MKSRVVTFVGGPLCGKVKRMPPEKLVEFVGFTRRKREYLYRYAILGQSRSAEPFRIRHRYVFLGHDAKLPEGVEEVD